MPEENINKLTEDSFGKVITQTGTANQAAKHGFTQSTILLERVSKRHFLFLALYSKLNN